MKEILALKFYSQHIRNNSDAPHIGCKRYCLEIDDLGCNKLVQADVKRKFFLIKLNVDSIQKKY